MSHRVFIVEDDALIRQGYALLFELEDDLEICGEAENGAEALERLPGSEAEAVVVDLTLPGMTGLELVGEITSRWPEIPVLVLSGRSEEECGDQVRAAGAVGFLDKKEADMRLVDVLRSVLDGGGM